jgi:hypothetical protein
MDCNFRLSRKNVSSQEADPGLCQGTAYFVEQSKYKQHLEENDDLPQEASILSILVYRYTDTIFGMIAERLRWP